MIITNITLTPSTPHHVTASWTTSNQAYVAWVYVDGERSTETVSLDTTNSIRSITVPWEYNESHCIEIHEVLSTVAAVATLSPRLTTQPTISWNDTTAAETYRLYHRATASGTDSLLSDDEATADAFGICSLLCPDVLDGEGGKWHWFRVEAVDKYGNESTRVSWRYWAAEPDDVATLAVTSGTETGKYDLTLTEQ